jgi:hypothetical protein
MYLYKSRDEEKIGHIERDFNDTFEQIKDSHDFGSNQHTERKYKKALIV